MLDILVALYVLPLLGCLILCLPYRFQERTITRLTGFCLLVPALTTLFLIVYEGIIGHLPFEHEVLRLILWGHRFDLLIWVDINSILMMGLTHILGLLVVRYSHGYLHLEKGYQRFFSTILFFIFGMYILSLAGTMDLFFAGWEVVGLSSFFLVAFYRSHTRSVANAWRIYNIYRICDVGLLVGAVLGHVLWHEATRFSQIANLTPESLAGIPTSILLFMGLFLVFAAVGKSAQFPFHSWPARAMEGPTPSSAIFYGALSIHAGVFLLVRNYPLWSARWEVKVVIALIGALTFIFSTLQGRVQSNIKGQIAFASTAQIGIMFIELSLGLTNFAMWHLFCHALYRCFQLLVSPSIVFNSMSITNKVTLDRIHQSKKWEYKFLPKRVNATLYTLALSDFAMDTSWRGFGFLPWRRAFKWIETVLARPGYAVPVILFLSPLANWGTDSVFTSPKSVALMLSSLSLYFSMRALLHHTDAFLSMVDLLISLTIDMLSVYLVDHHFMTGAILYAASVFPAAILGLVICHKYRHMDLRDYHAQGTVHTVHANLYLVSFMVLAGMPVSTAFFGEDVILEDLIARSLPMACFTSLSLMLNGLICVRIYTRIFMGSRSNLRKEGPHA